MITPDLIELIRKGKARFKTWTTGLCSICAIPIQENSHIVITGFIYENFADYGVLPKTHASLLKRDGIVHTLKFADQKNEYDFILRSDMIEHNFLNARQELESNVSVFGHHNIDNVYMVFGGRFARILCLRWPRVGDCIFNQAALPRDSDEPQPPTGLLNSNLEAYQITLLPDGQPAGLVNPNFDRLQINPIPPRVRSKLIVDSVGNTATDLFRPVNGDEQSTFLLTVKYVEINGSIPLNLN